MTGTLTARRMEQMARITKLLLSSWPWAARYRSRYILARLQVVLSQLMDCMCWPKIGNWDGLGPKSSPTPKNPYLEHPTHEFLVFFCGDPVHAGRRSRELYYWVFYSVAHCAGIHLLFQVGSLHSEYTFNINRDTGLAHTSNCFHGIR